MDEDKERINILIADDEMENCQLIRKGLLRQGFNVDVAFNGREALDRMKINNYDFVFLDFNMPELTGVEVAKIIRERGSNCVIVVISGYPVVDEFFSKTLGVDEYLEKPFSLENIKAIIEKYIKKSRRDE